MEDSRQQDTRAEAIAQHLSSKQQLSDVCYRVMNR